MQRADAQLAVARPILSLSRLITALELALLIGLPLLLLAAWHTTPENGYLYDDAYISFRYSVNLANGHGLVWNVGGPPTQGYTNFLFVLLTALGIKFGLQAVHAAHLLNAVGVALLALSGYAMARSIFPQPFLRLLPGLAVALAPLTLVNAMTGMETVFWAGLVLAAAALAFLYLRVPDTRLLVAHAVVAFLGCLTRPESVLFAALWLLILFLGARGHRRVVVITGLAFGAAGAAYLLWLHLYFGAILPNSFNVKVATPDLLPGRGYVEEFLRDQVLALGPLLLPLIGLLALPRRAVLLLATNGVVLTLLGFYLFAAPLMGLYYRFLYPVAVLILLLAAFGAVGLLERVLMAASHRRELPSLPALRAVLLMGLLWLIGVPVLNMVQGSIAEPMSAGALFYANLRAGEAIARVPEAAQITVAYNDVGILPFISGAKNLDTVGLNENEIARHGKERGWLWIVGYVLGSRPDLIGFYTFPDGTVYNYGHGLIGGYYSVLASAADFTGNYTYVGGFDAEWVHIQWYVYNDSPHREAIQQVFARAADFRDYTLRLP